MVVGDKKNAKKNDVLPTILSTELVVSNNRFLHIT